MYNRYIPQPDGTYRRNRISEPSKEQPKAPAISELPFESQHTESSDTPHCQNCIHSQSNHRPIPPRPKKVTPPMGIGPFLRSLLPHDFDTEDLLIVLLLLLMAGDHKEDQNSALLTLALYLFM